MNAHSLETVQAVAALYNANAPMREIAEKTGCSAVTIRNMKARYDDLFIGRRGEDYGDRVQRALALWNRKLTTAQIGERLSMTEKAVRSMISKHRELFGHRRVPKAANSAPKPVRKPAGVKPARAKPAPAARKSHVVHVQGFAPPPAVYRGPVLLTALSDHVCRWPMSGQAAETLFCGATISKGRIYCDGHRARAFQARAC